MKLEQMTKEELIAAREIHEKAGATLKVAKIDELLEGMLVHKWEGDAEPQDEPISDVAFAYQLKMSTDMTWKQIGDRVGLKAQGLYAKVKKYARENELPYE